MGEKASEMKQNFQETDFGKKTSEGFSSVAEKTKQGLTSVAATTKTGMFYAGQKASEGFEYAQKGTKVAMVSPNWLTPGKNSRGHQEELRVQ